MFDFSNKVIQNQDIITSFNGKSLVLKNVFYYNGPVTMQYLPYGGIQSVFNNIIIINSVNGFIGCVDVIYDGINYSSKQFIENNPNLVNTILPN